jgi:hypothetical protein
MRAHNLYSADHCAHEYRVFSSTLGAMGPSREDHRQAARCAVGTGGFCLLQSGSGAGIAASTSGRRSCGSKYVAYAGPSFQRREA